MNIVQIVDSKGNGAWASPRERGRAAEEGGDHAGPGRLALKEGRSLSAMASALAGTATEDYAKALKEKRC